ncbi:hypothetical protein [Anaerophaga thermohalophila]|jgi:hypothetical protein|nr:hypothetical protein [Anaerophaga thermohalophila]
MVALAMPGSSVKVIGLIACPDLSGKKRNSFHTDKTGDKDNNFRKL